MTNRTNVAIMMDIIKLANRRRAPVTPALYPVNPIATIAAPISISGAGDQDDDCPIEYRKVEFVEGFKVHENHSAARSRGDTSRQVAQNHLRTRI
jgi:hypothetical protein